MKKNTNSYQADIRVASHPLVPESKKGKAIISGMIFLFLSVTMYKMTNMSIWFDEAVEYLVSTMPFGKMIGAIQNTWQPPLYNFIMHFLLKISVSEYWFHFISVLFGVGGLLGLYAAVNEICGWRIAAVSMFMYSFLFRIWYYNQECSEYALVVALLFWMVFFFARLLRQFSIKRGIGFLLFAVLSIFSHYGATFAVVSTAVVLLVYYFIHPEFL